MAKVLIVEDDAPLRALYRDVLEHGGFEVIEATDGITAVDTALTEHPDLILLDLMLPRQGGLSVVKVLRTMPDTARLPVIILTAFPNPEYKEEVAARVQGFYSKTELKPHQLVDKVRQLLPPQ